MGHCEWPIWSKDNTKWTSVSDPDECFATLHERLVCDKMRISYLEEENKRLKSEAYKDEELKKMAEERDEAKMELRRGFPISEKENDAIKNWTNKHILEKHSHLTEDGQRIEDYNGAAGGRFEYRFYPTGLGTIGTIKCTCGAEFCFRELE